MSELDFSQVRAVVEKLLHKAGKDPRVTPKILRVKVESKLELSSGRLKTYRNQIKDVIWEWWESDQTYTLQQLVFLSRALQLAPAILKGIKEMTSVTEKVEALTSRLKEKNIKFSSCPTDEEIENAKKESVRQKSLDEADPSLIVEGKRKRVDISVGADENNRKKRIIADDDEEAEF
jgi:hypothetical protein